MLAGCRSIGVPAVFLFLVLRATAVFAWPVVELEPLQDNTLYETAIDVDGMQNERSNGAGDFLFAGRTGLDAGFKRRRALLKFDLSTLPAGAEVVAASLTLYHSKAAPDSPPVVMRLHRVLAPWGESGSDAIGPEGQGDIPDIGDATWQHGLYPDLAWSTPGGDFIETSSASITLGQQQGPYTWTCTDRMLADLALWLAHPLVNFGWMVVGGEEGGFSAHRFNSRENGATETRPRLTVVYRPAGSVLINGFESRPACGSGG